MLALRGLLSGAKAALFLPDNIAYVIFAFSQLRFLPPEKPSKNAHYVPAAAFRVAPRVPLPAMK
jgi:hypothetical protein